MKKIRCNKKQAEENTECLQKAFPRIKTQAKKLVNMLGNVLENKMSLAGKDVRDKDQIAKNCLLLEQVMVFYLTILIVWESWEKVNKKIKL